MSAEARAAIVRRWCEAARRGNLAEIWDHAADPGLHQQLGILPAPGQAGR